MNVAIIGSNFALKGYLPAIKKITNFKLKTICSRNIKKIKQNEIENKNITLEKNWKKVFNRNIDLVILAVPPVLQEKILFYNLKYKKKIIFEKPITHNYLKSKKIIELMKSKKIQSSINLTYVNHELFRKIKIIINNKNLGKVTNYKITWNFKSQDFNQRIKTWKTDEKKGGGIKNIFLTHLFSYCEFLFGTNQIINTKVKYQRFKGINYKKFISIKTKNPKNVNGKLLLYNKKKGHQNHNILVQFEKGHIQLFTKSKDWTKDFVLIIRNKNKNKTTKFISSNNFKDGRSKQIYTMLKDFIKIKNYNKIDYCLNAEKLNSKIN
tara:strand:+ start:559 stop:1527 length:969 start_codon:yes stop_codon:yes gene_type:complete